MNEVIAMRTIYILYVHTCAQRYFIFLKSPNKRAKKVKEAKKLSFHLVDSKKLTTFALANSERHFRKANSECNAPLAQLVEQLTLNQWVQGSNP